MKRCVNITIYRTVYHEVTLLIISTEDWLENYFENVWMIHPYHLDFCHIFYFFRRSVGYLLCFLCPIDLGQSTVLNCRTNIREASSTSPLRRASEGVILPV